MRATFTVPGDNLAVVIDRKIGTLKPKVLILSAICRICSLL